MRVFTFTYDLVTRVLERNSRRPIMDRLCREFDILIIETGENPFPKRDNSRFKQVIIGNAVGVLMVENEVPE